MPASIPPGPRRWVLTILSVLLLLTFLGVAIAYAFSYPLVKYFVESPAGENVASSGLSKLIKVDGDFSPLHLNGWTLTFDQFTSTGWPGEALGGLNTYGVTAQIDPEAVWRGVYHIKAMQVDHADVTLLTPNQALKRPQPPKKPRPWYAHFLPSVFELGPITTPHARIDFEFEHQKAHILDANMEADLIGRDFRYTVYSGTLQFPFLPDMHIDKLALMVTRPMITIENAQLSGLTVGDPARASLYGNLGQHEDKTVNAIVELTQVPIEQVLPPEMAAMIHGRATGHVTWKKDTSGKDIFSDGNLDVSGATIADFSVFKQLSILHGNPDLVNFTFDQLHLKYQMHNGKFFGDVVAVSNGKFSLTGTIGYDQATKEASIDAKFGDLPLQVWLPNEFKPQTSGFLTAALHWKGQMQSIKDSSGAVSINLDGAQIHDPEFLRHMLAKKKLRAPEDLGFKTAELDFTYQDQTFQLTHAQLEVPGVVTASATGTLTAPDRTLDADVTWNGLTLANWLPEQLAEQVKGDINGGVKFHVHQFKLKDGTYTGDVQLVNGELSYTSVQSMLARFVGDKRLLDIPLNRASFTFYWDNGALSVDQIDLRGADDIGVEGSLAMTRGGALSGTLWVGTRADYLKTLAGLADAVFTRHDEGLRWAKVHVSGTAKEPRQDLSKQLMAQLSEHPTALFSLSGKLISWYVGDALFDAGDEWKKPDAKVP